MAGVRGGSYCTCPLYSAMYVHKLGGLNIFVRTLQRLTVLLQANKHSLLYGRNERFIRYRFLWQSCTDVRVPAMMYVRA